MIGPFQVLANAQSTAQTVENSARSDLLTASPQSPTELPDIAIGGASNTQSLQSELPPHIHEIAGQIGQIQSEFKNLEEKAQKAKELDELRSRLLMGKKQVIEGMPTFQNVSIALSNYDKVMKSNNSFDAKKISDISNNSDFILAKKTAAVIQKNDPQIKDPSIAGIDDQQNILIKIDEALNTLNNIIDKINNDQSSSNSRLLSLTGSITTLNAARSTVDKTQLSLNVASNAVDMIMTNIKTAIFSHGKVSNDIVRLVLA
jgi:hypothetical protein